MPIPRFRRSVPLSAGSALAALMLATPALAQSIPAPVGPPIETRIAADGSSSSDAGLVLLSVQDSEAPNIVSRQDAGAVVVTLYGVTGQTNITATDNLQSAAATANDAANTLELNAALLSDSAALTNVQSGKGSTSVILGSRTDGSTTGVTIAPQDTLDHAHVAVVDNQATGVALANRASNSLIAETAPAVSARIAVAGTLGSDHGAVGALTLVNWQEFGKLPVPGAPLARVSSEVVSRFGVDGDFTAPGSTLVIAGNVQKAVAAANNSSSAIDAVSADGGIALTSFQYGQADVSALAELKLPGKAGGSGVATSITDNKSSALAVMNDGDNALTLSPGASRTSTATGTAFGSAGGYAPPYATGQTAMANQQFAIGSVTATSAARAFPSDMPVDTDAAQVVISGNSAVAEASANRAANRIAAGDGAALVSSQANLASVSAVASMSVPAGFGTMAADTRIHLSDNSAAALARGNVADNDLHLGATAPVSPLLADATTSGVDMDAQGNSVLLNTQSNEARISALASSAAPLNMGEVGGASLTLRAASVDTSAYGNAALNAVSYETDPAGIVLANSQVNRGAVTASAGGSAIGATGMPGASLAFTGNRISATAFGNQAVNLITFGR